MPVNFALSAAFGWTAVVLMIAATLLPYLLRSTALSRALGIAVSSKAAFFERMRPHAWLGYTIVALGGLHTFAASAGGLGRFEPAGLWLAAMALSLVAAQWLLGSMLMRRALAPRRQVRRWHFGVMLGASAAVFAHAYLNGALLRSLLP